MASACKRGSEARSLESLLPALLDAANNLQQSLFHVLHPLLSAVRGTVTQQSPLTSSQETALPSETLRAA